MEDKRSRHLRIADPSPWLVRFAPLFKPGGEILDLACGGGRHGRWLLAGDNRVTMLDRDISAVTDLKDHPGAEIIEFDLERGEEIFSGSGPLAKRLFDAVVVVNYLYRPLFDGILNAISDGGVLIYETFARGNERFNRPRNPDHLLKCGELLAAVEGQMQVVAYEHGIVEKRSTPGVISGVVQRICAVSEPAGERHQRRPDGEPEPRAIYPL